MTVVGYERRVNSDNDARNNADWMELKLFKWLSDIKTLVG